KFHINRIFLAAQVHRTGRWATLEAEGGPEVAQEERVSSKLLDQLAYVLRCCCLRAKDKRLSKISPATVCRTVHGRSASGGSIRPWTCQAYRKIGWGICSAVSAVCQHFAQSAWQVLSPPPNEADDPRTQTLLHRLTIRYPQSPASRLFNAAWSRVSVTSTLDVLRLRDNAESDWLLELGRGQDSATRHLRRLTGFLSAAQSVSLARANSRLPDIVDQLIGLVGSPYRTVSTDASVALVRLCTELGPIISGFRLLAPGLETVLGALTLMIAAQLPVTLLSITCSSVPDWQAVGFCARCLATVQLSDHSNKAEVEALIRSCVVQMSRNYHSLGTHDPDLANKVVAELTELQDRSSGAGSEPSLVWLLTSGVGSGELVESCCRRLSRAGSAVFTDQSSSIVVHSDWYRNGCDHVFGLPGNKSNAVFQVRDPNAPPDYVDCKLDESLQL
uniref:HECT domain-containing protein n=1 Tax=Macrostomum lignano TaxID=282301 RepID=A0A1I8FLG9_9PLAT